MRVPYLFIVLLLVLTTPAWPQRLDFTPLGVENGLSQKSVLAIAQDSRGFLWFGTANGLNRYDSRTFKTYSDNQTANGLSSAYILSLLNDARGTLWVGTSNGLYIYQPQTDYLLRVKLPKAADGTETHSINALFGDRQNRIWVGTTSGLYLLSAQHQVIGFFKAGTKGLSGNNIHAIISDTENNIWVGTNKGLNRLQPRGATFAYLTFRHNNQPGNITDDNISSLAIDNGNHLWIGFHEKGLDTYNPATKSFTHYANTSDPGDGSDNIRKIIVDGGKLWIGTQGGLVTFDRASHRFYNYKHDPDNSKSINQNSIYSLFFDKNHTLWVGTYFGGVNIAATPIFNIYRPNTANSSISNNVISAMAEDAQHNLWVGTEGGGLNYINQPDGKVTAYQHQKNNSASISSSLIKAVYRDSDGNIWTGTHGGGLNVLVPGQSAFAKYLYNENDPDIAVSEVRGIAEASGLFWVGTNTGLKVFARNKNQLTPYPDVKILQPLQSQTINCLFTDSKNTLWAGGWGIYSLPAGAKHIIASPLNKTALNTRINCITEDKQGNIWIGTDARGLFKYNTITKKITQYTETEGLANNNVYGVVQDEQANMWISTGNGLSELAPTTGVFHNYTASDGLAGNEFNKNSYLRLSSGQILFGGFNGYTGFYPGNIKGNETKPAVFITGLKLFNKPVVVGDSTGILPAAIDLSSKIVLQYTQNVFTVNFVILNYIRSEKNKYAYQIQNIDKNWNYTTIPAATYNNLPPGRYRFLARGQNNDGVWSDTASILIIVQPPWWRTWWAYGLYLLVLAGIVFLIVRFFFIRALLRRDQELTALKLNFFTNISHEIRTHLSLISAPVEKLLMNNSIPDDHSRQLQTIKRNSDDLLQLVNELMDFRKAETGNLTLHISRFNIVPFVQSVCQSFQEISVEKNINTDFIAASPRIDLYFDKEQMKKVLFNLLSNAYKFTPAGGRVSVSVNENADDTISINVADNGKGISPENLENLFNNYFQENDYGHQNTGYGIGLALSKSIVVLHNGSLNVESDQAAGETAMTTCFTIKLKKGSSHFDTSVIMPGEYALQPIDDEINQPDPPIQLNEGALPATNEPAKIYSILIVEDNPEVRKFIVEAFNSSYHVLEAANGQIGFETAVEQIPDLIISDVMMPEMDGFTLCTKIKTDERTDHIPIILLTAQASVPNQVSGLERGADVYLTKPFSVQILILQVKNLINSAEKQRNRYSIQLISEPLTKPPELQNEFLQKIITLAETHIADANFDVEMICRHVAMSQTVLYKKLKALTSLNLNDIIKEVRFKKAAELLLEQKYTVYEVADMVGYQDQKYFSREFKKKYGVAPRDYKPD
ncbi:MAG: two-component regulator propeller domain-containing protein [Bacteroidota bacterium]